MALTDLSLAELETYRPEVAEPANFDAFWADTLTEARSFPLEVSVTPVETPFKTIEVFDVVFPGFNGDPIGAWLTLPRGIEGPLPAVVQFIGYNGGRNLPGIEQQWASAGYAHFHVDTRGQGTGWAPGRTADPHGSTPNNGFITNGIESRETFYYRRVFTDAVRAVEAVRTLPQVDGSRVAVQGGSQGGAITLAVAGLVPDLVGLMPDVPFLCNFRRAVDVCDADPYKLITGYLSVHRDKWEQTFQTLSYFDGVNFAKRATAPSLFSIALMDRICPPSTCFSAYNVYAGEHEIEVYPYNDHEGGHDAHRIKQIHWLNKRLAS